MTSFHWTIGCFEEGPILRLKGPLWMVEVFPWLLCSYNNTWSRFLTFMAEPDNEKSRRKWRRRGYRRVKVRLVIELEPLNASTTVSS